MFMIVKVHLVLLSHILPPGASVKLWTLSKQNDRSFERLRFDRNIEQKVGNNTDPRHLRCRGLTLILGQSNRGRPSALLGEELPYHGMKLA